MAQRRSTTSSARKKTAKSTGSRKRSTASRSRSKKAAPQHELPGGWWRQIVAFLMLVVSVILIFGWLGDGGPVLNQINQAIYSWVGGAEYAIPVLLVWLAVKIFRSDNNRLPPVMWTASILMVLWLTGFIGTFSYDQGGQTGGLVGQALNDLVSQIGDTWVMFFIYAVLIFVTALFVLQISPATVFQAIGRMFSAKEAGEARPAKKVAKATKPGRPEKQLKEEKLDKTHDDDVEIKVNAGVATADESAKEAPAPRRHGLFGGRAAKTEEPAAVEPDKKEAGALVVVNNPDWKMPTVNLFEKKQSPASPGDVQQNAQIIKTTLADFGIDVEMEGANVGPRVTQYTMRPPAGVNLSKILARNKELGLNLAVDKIRIEAPIPGTRLVGVELPNAKSADVRLRGVLESAEWKKTTDPLAFAVGKDISGKAVVANLAKMPHLLIAGTTGSGKSVMTNTLITSLLFHNAPSDLKLIIVDPKQVEMAQYNDIPHLLTPIITQVDKALSAMKWAVNEMEKRYSIMAEEKVKNIVDYNAKMDQKAVAGAEGAEGGATTEKMPYIVILIDEMADLMMVAGKDMEMPIVRIAQKGRAAGIHLVLATQRPEVKVITGLIKANIPGRIAFAVNSQIDSRVMLDMTGAETLLGKGDMLMLTTEMMGKPRRIQGAWASDEDVLKLTDFLRAQQAPQYNDEVISQAVQVSGMGPSMGGAIGDLGRKYDPNDPMVRAAVEIMLTQGKFSTSMLQTRLGKGHGFVSGLALWLEEIGAIGPENGHKPRDVLIKSMDEFDELVQNR